MALVFFSYQNFIIILIIGFVAAAAIIYPLSAIAHPSFEGFESEVDKLKMTHPAVIKFYQNHDTVFVQKYDHKQDLLGIMHPEEKFRIAFTAKENQELFYLGVNYFAWQPFGVIYQCLSEEIVWRYTDQKAIDVISSSCGWNVQTGDKVYSTSQIT